MLITFECSVYPNITMFGNIANKLIVHMGQNASVAGRLNASGVASALENIIDATQEEMLAKENRGGIALRDDREFYLSIDKRPRSLIHLLRAASEQGVPVIWYLNIDQV